MTHHSLLFVSLHMTPHSSIHNPCFIAALHTRRVGSASRNQCLGNSVPLFSWSSYPYCCHGGDWCGGTERNTHPGRWPSRDCSQGMERLVTFYAGFWDFSFILLFVSTNQISISILIFYFSWWLSFNQNTCSFELRVVIISWFLVNSRYLIIQSIYTTWTEVRQPGSSTSWKCEIV